MSPSFDGAGAGVIPVFDTIYYVDQAVAATGNGSIAAPFATIAEGIAAIGAGNFGELRIASGDYEPEIPLVMPAGSGILFKHEGVGLFNLAGIGPSIDMGTQSTVFLQGVGEGQSDFGDIKAPDNASGLVAKDCAFVAEGATALAGRLAIDAFGCSFECFGDNNGDTDATQWSISVSVAVNCSFSGTVRNLDGVYNSEIGDLKIGIADSTTYTGAGAPGIYESIINGPLAAGGGIVSPINLNIDEATLAASGVVSGGAVPPLALSVIDQTNIRLVPLERTLPYDPAAPTVLAVGGTNTNPIELDDWQQPGLLTGAPGVGETWVLAGTSGGAVAPTQAEWEQVLAPGEERSILVEVTTANAITLAVQGGEGTILGAGSIAGSSTVRLSVRRTFTDILFWVETLT